MITFQSESYVANSCYHDKYNSIWIHNHMQTTQPDTKIICVEFRSIKALQALVDFETSF